MTARELEDRLLRGQELYKAAKLAGRESRCAALREHYRGLHRQWLEAKRARA